MNWYRSIKFAFNTYFDIGHYAPKNMLPGQKVALWQLDKKGEFHIEYYDKDDNKGETGAHFPGHGLPEFNFPEIHIFASNNKQIKESQAESELDYLQIGHQSYDYNFSGLNRKELPTGKEKIWTIDKDWKINIEEGTESHHSLPDWIARGRLDTHGKDNKNRVSIILNDEILTYRRERVYNKVVKILDKQFGYPELHRFSSFAGNLKTAAPIIDNSNDTSYGRIGHSWGITPENDEILWIINKDWKLETGRAKVHHNLWKDSDNIVASGRLVINRKTGNKTVSARIHDIYFQNKKVNKQREEYLKKRVEKILDNGFGNPTIYHFSAGKIKIKEAQVGEPIENYMDVGHNDFRASFREEELKNCNDKIWWIDNRYKIHIKSGTGENARKAHYDFEDFRINEKTNVAKGRYDECGPNNSSRISVNVHPTGRRNDPLRERKKEFLIKKVTKILDEAFDYPTIHITN